MALRIVFMGTPDYGVPSLDALVNAGYDVVGVFCQPDKPSGRGKKITFCPVKQYAVEHNIPVFQPQRTRVDGVEPLRNLAPDLCVTAAFGHILSQEVLDIPHLGTVNVHASLLPEYRGSAPVNWALIKGEKVTGVTTMMTDKGMDTGDILMMREVEILPDENAGELVDRLAKVGAELLIETLHAMENGTCPREKQDESKASYYPLLKKEMGKMDLSKPAEELCCFVRGMTPWPCAYAGPYKVLKAKALDYTGTEAPGTILTADPKQGLVVKAGDGALKIEVMQAPGSKAMNACDYLRGHKMEVGTNIVPEKLQMQNKPGKNNFRSDRPQGKRPFNSRPGTGRPGAGRPGTGKPQFNQGTPRPRPVEAKPEQRSDKPAMAPSNANPRMVALNVVCDVLNEDAYASLSLDDRLSKVNLNQLDRRLCASIVYRTLENLYAIDFALAAYLRDAEAIEARVRNILRTAACQILLHDRVPDSAAVNEAVKITRVIGMEPFVGMVNAVLRKLAEGKENIAWPKEDEGARYLSIKYSLPEWLAQQLIDDYGMELARDIAAYRTEKHFITVRPTYGREEEFKQGLSRKVWEKEDGVMPGAVRVYGAMQIARDTEFLNGIFSIQGEGSMLAAEAVQVKRGMNVLDCCAAPGGKTAYMAERMDGTGRVYAWDLHSHRADLIRAAVRRLNLDNVRASARDASVLRDEMIDSMDAVLLDAPCTGLGVMDDKPDVKYRHTQESVQELVHTQKKLLDTCCRYVKKGGTLVYSTCSVLKDENERQVKAFLKAHPEFVIDQLPDSIPESLRKQAGENGLQLLPCRDGVEGFFVARMKRIG